MAFIKLIWGQRRIFHRRADIDIRIHCQSIRRRVWSDRQDQWRMEWRREEEHIQWWRRRIGYPHRLHITPCPHHRCRRRWVRRIDQSHRRRRRRHIRTGLSRQWIRHQQWARYCHIFRLIIIHHGILSVHYRYGVEYRHIWRIRVRRERSKGEQWVWWSRRWRLVWRVGHTTRWVGR